MQIYRIPTDLTTKRILSIRSSSSTSGFRNRSNNGVASFPLSSMQPSASSKQFALRKNMSEIEESLNSHLPLYEETSSVGRTFRPYTKVLKEKKVEPFRYMFEKLTEKGDGK